MESLAWGAYITAFILTLPGATAQPLENGARVAGTSGAGAATSGVFTLRLNPASVCNSPPFFLVMGHSRAFGLPELDHYQFAIGKDLGGITLAAGLESFGYEAFGQKGLHLFGARNMDALGLSAGAVISAERVAIPEVETLTVVRNGVGIIVQLPNHVHVGAAVHRLFQIGRAPEEGRLLIVGASLRATPRLLLVVDAMKDARFPISMRGGLELLPVPALALRGGMSTEPEAISLGLGIDAGLTTLDLAANRHATLGWSRAVSISIKV